MSLNIYSIRSSLSFVDTLASGLLAKYGDDNLQFSKVTILLPNRRSCRVLRDAFLRQSEGKSLLLPSICGIGDIDEEGLLLSGKVDIEFLSQLKPSISPLLRRLIMAELVRKWGGKGGKYNIEQAILLAIELISFLDEVQREGLSLDNLKNIVPDELSKHWQLTLDFFDMLSNEWPAKLKQFGCIDIVEKRNILIEKQAEIWRDNPPENPVIIAGSTGSIPSTTLLFKSILGLNNCSIILPALDFDIDNESWEKIGEVRKNDIAMDECHPQDALKNLLSELRISKNEVLDFSCFTNDTSVTSYNSERENLLREIMRPSETCYKWLDIKLSNKSIENFYRIDADNLQEEAGCIALIMREVLEESGKTAALVTNDRSLAKMVVSLMRNWNVDIDDTAGKPLADTDVMIFLRLIAEMVSSRFSPVKMLSALKHPFASCGYSRAEFRSYIYDFEKIALRGVRISDGFEGFYSLIDEDKNTNEDRKISIKQCIKKIEEVCSDYYELMKSDKFDLKKIVIAHLECAEKLAESPEKSGEEYLWAGDEGEQASLFIKDFIDSTSYKIHCDPQFYSGIFEIIQAGSVFRPKYGSHSRLAILTPMEARLRHYDVMILGELNTGSWPADSSSTWMSRSMRNDFGLPSSAKRIGQSAHDFVCCASAKEVYLTRAEKVGGTPMVACSWLMRLDVVLGDLSLESSDKWLKWARELSLPDADVIAALPPEPRPPIESRPTRFSVTGIEKLMRDPYAIYAAKILNLRKLDNIDKEPDASEFGSLAHEALEKFVDLYEGKSEDEERAKLLKIGDELFAKYKHKQAISAIWKPRFESMAGWFVSFEFARQIDIKQSVVENAGSFALDISGVNFVLTAKADRIDIMNDGMVRIVDYKTGIIPSQKNIEEGFSSQLTLEAMMIERGAFDNLKGQVSLVEYRKLAGKLSISEKASQIINLENNDLINEAESGIKNLLTAFQNLETPYYAQPNDKYKLKYNDYEHLARVKEWANN